MSKPTMCPNPECPEYSKRRTVLGGCECGTALIPWRDPDVPTVEQIAYIVCDVAELEGKPVPRNEIERILHRDQKIHEMWLNKLSEIDWKLRLLEILRSERITDILAERAAMGSPNIIPPDGWSHEPI